MTVSTAAARRANSSYTLAEATGCITTSGTEVLFVNSTTVPTTLTLFPNQTYRIISQTSAINYSVGRTDWTVAGHRSGYLPSDLYETFHTTERLVKLGVTLASGVTDATDVYITQMITSDTTNGYLSFGLLGL